MCDEQGAEIWEELGEWITANKPELGPGTKERFQMCSKLTPEEVIRPLPYLQQSCARLESNIATPLGCFSTL